MPEFKPFDEDRWTTAAAYIERMDLALLRARAILLRDLAQPAGDTEVIAAASKAYDALTVAATNPEGLPALHRALATAQKFDPSIAQAMHRASHKSFERYTDVAHKLLGLMQDPSRYDAHGARNLETLMVKAHTALKATTAVFDNAAQARSDAAVRDRYKFAAIDLSKAAEAMKFASAWLDQLSFEQQQAGGVPKVAPGLNAEREDVRARCINLFERVLAPQSRTSTLSDQIGAIDVALSSKEQQLLDHAGVRMQRAFAAAREGLGKDGRVVSLMTIAVAMPEVLEAIDQMCSALTYSIRIAEPLWEPPSALQGDASGAGVTLP